MSGVSSAKRRRRVVARFAFASAVFGAAELIFDSVISNNYAQADDKLTAASAYLFVGAWLGLTVSAICAVFFGRLDPDHKRLHVPKGDSLKYAVASGTIGAVATGLFLWANQYFDLGITSAVASIYVLFVILYEWRRGRIALRHFLLPGVLTMAGAILVAYKPAWEDGAFGRARIGVLLGIAIVYGMLRAVGFVWSNHAVQKSDSVNIELIRFFTLTSCGTALAWGAAAIRGEWNAFWEACGKLVSQPEAVAVLGVLFCIVFTGQIFELIAKKRSDEIASIAVVVGLRFGLSFAAAWAIHNYYKEGYVGDVPTEPGTVAVRVAGASLLLLAVFALRKNEQKILGKKA